MRTETRIVTFGIAFLFVLAGIAGAVLIGGFPGDLLALVLIASGLVAATSLVFFEVGMSEDRERAQESARRERAEQRRRPRFSRLRSHRNTLD
jgi:uncharacterized membrane protein